MNDWLSLGPLEQRIRAAAEAGDGEQLRAELNACNAEDFSLRVWGALAGMEDGATLTKLLAQACASATEVSCKDHQNFLVEVLYFALRPDYLETPDQLKVVNAAFEAGLVPDEMKLDSVLLRERAVQGETEVVEALISRGVPFTGPRSGRSDFPGETYADLAWSLDKREMATLLARHGSEFVRHREAGHLHALQGAVEQGYTLKRRI